MYLSRGDSTVLSVYVITMENQDTNTLTEDDEKKSGMGSLGSTAGLESKTLVWRITTRKFDSAKPEWMYAQVAVSPETSYRVRDISQRECFLKMSHTNSICFAHRYSLKGKQA